MEKAVWYEVVDSDAFNFDHGPVYSLTIPGQPVIVLNTAQSVKDLLEKCSSIYSDRPRYIVVLL